MSRNEEKTCRELIEPALQSNGWAWDRRLPLGPGPVNLAEGSMYDPNQKLILDYLLRFGHIDQITRKLVRPYQEMVN